jgi:hypothetical protein
LSFIYLLALVGVSASILWLLVDAVMSVTRKPSWEVAPIRSFMLVTTEERRTQSPPFIGVDRRLPQANAAANEEERLVA